MRHAHKYKNIFAMYKSHTKKINFLLTIRPQKTRKKNSREVQFKKKNEFKI